MCGRFSLYSDPQKVSDYFNKDITANFESNYNIAPSNYSLAFQNEVNKPSMIKLKWGFSFKTEKNKSKMIINARSETLQFKKVFSSLIPNQRCLIIANSWFEWNKAKTPYLIYNKNIPLITFAGLKRVETNGDQTFVIITSEAKGKLADLHKRTPSIIKKEDHHIWLKSNSEKALDLLQSISSDEYLFYRVSSKVGSVKNNNSSVIEKSFKSESQQLYLF